MSENYNFIIPIDLSNNNAFDEKQGVYSHINEILVRNNHPRIMLVGINANKSVYSEFGLQSFYNLVIFKYKKKATFLGLKEINAIDSASIKETMELMAAQLINAKLANIDEGSNKSDLAAVKREDTHLAAINTPDHPILKEGAQVKINDESQNILLIDETNATFSEIEPEERKTMTMHQSQPAQDKTNANKPRFWRQFGKSILAATAAGAIPTGEMSLFATPVGMAILGGAGALLGPTVGFIAGFASARIDFSRAASQAAKKEVIPKADATYTAGTHTTYFILTNMIAIFLCIPKIFLIGGFIFIFSFWFSLLLD